MELDWGSRRWGDGRRGSAVWGCQDRGGFRRAARRRGWAAGRRRASSVEGSSIGDLGWACRSELSASPARARGLEVRKVRRVSCGRDFKRGGSPERKRVAARGRYPFVHGFGIYWAPPWLVVTRPVMGSSRYSPELDGLLKSNMPLRVPASASKEPVMRCPPSQLSSMKRRMED